MRRTTIWPLACAVGVVVGVGACTSSTGQSEQTTSAATTESATASPSQSASPSTAPTTADAGIPAEVRAATADGAISFVRYWAAQFNRGLQEADPTLIGGLSSPACPACQGLAKDTQELKDAKSHVQGDAWTLVDPIISSFDNASAAVVISGVQQNPVPVVLAGSGEIVRNYKSESSKLAFTLTHNGSRWQLDRLQISK